MGDGRDESGEAKHGHQGSALLGRGNPAEFSTLPKVGRLGIKIEVAPRCEWDSEQAAYNDMWKVCRGQTRMRGDSGCVIGVVVMRQTRKPGQFCSVEMVDLRAMRGGDSRVPRAMGDDH